jgi:hypothetical protein
LLIAHRRRMWLAPAGDMNLAEPIQAEFSTKSISLSGTN